MGVGSGEGAVDRCGHAGHIAKNHGSSDERASGLLEAPRTGAIGRQVLNGSPLRDLERVSVEQWCA